MDLLIYACGVFGATGYEYKLKKKNEDGGEESVDNILEHMFSGIKTAQTILINAEFFFK